MPERITKWCSCPGDRCFGNGAACRICCEQSITYKYMMRASKFLAFVPQEKLEQIEAEVAKLESNITMTTLPEQPLDSPDKSEQHFECDNCGEFHKLKNLIQHEKFSGGELLLCRECYLLILADK